MGIGEQQEGDKHAEESGRESLRRLDLEAAAPEGKEREETGRHNWLQHEGPQSNVASQPHRSEGGAWPPQTEQRQRLGEAGQILPSVEERLETSWGGEDQSMLGTGQSLQPIEASFGGGAFQEYAGPGLRGTLGPPSRESEAEPVGAPKSSPPLRPQALNAPLIPHLNALDPRTLAGSTWSRTEASRWAAPNVSGLLNASGPAASLASPAPPIRPRAEPALRVTSAAAVLPVPDDLAARASGAWHASLGYHGAPGDTQGLAISSADITSLALGSLPPQAGGKLEWAPDKRSEKPSWLSLDLQSEQEKPARGGTPPRAQRSPPPLGGNGPERQVAAPGDMERSSWYEQFKANIPIIASQGDHVPSSTWALVQASGLQPPSPVLPSPMKPSPAAQFGGEKHASPGGRSKERKKEADFLSRMEQNESGGVQEEPAVPPVTQAAGLLFGGTYNAVVEAARSKALKEIKEIALPPLLTDPPPVRPPFSLPPKTALVIPPRALSTFLSTTQTGHEVRMDPLKPLDLSEAPPRRESPPASVSLKGWAGRSANPSLDISSPGGGLPRKRSRESSLSGDETRTLGVEVTKKKQRGKRSESLEPSTRLTLELGSSEERGGSGEVVPEGRAVHTPRLQSPSQRMAPGVIPVSVLGDPIGSAAANTAYAAYLDSMKAGMSLSHVAGPVRTSTPTGSSSGSAAQTTARNASLLWRGSSDETWNSERGGAEADPPQRRNVAATPLPGSLGFLRAQGGGEAAGRVAGSEPPPTSEGSRHAIAPSSGTEGGVARSSMASILGGYKAKLPGWPDKPMPADEYLEALQSSQFRLNAEEPTKSEAER